MINLNKNSAFNLKPIDEADVRSEVVGMFVEGEKILGAFKTVRDQVIFTNKRVITVDVQGITGKRKEYASLPYKNVQYFGVQTAGFLEVIPDCEMALWFNNGFKAEFEFKGNVNILAIAKSISDYVVE